MPHPLSIDPDDPHLGRVREICLALPGADEKVSHGRPCFFTKKVFAIFGGVVKGDHDPGPYACSLIVLPEPDDRLALLEDERFYLPGYYGPAGWVGLDFRACGGVDRVDWDEVAELVDASYRRTAPVTLVRQLDGDRLGR